MKVMIVDDHADMRRVLKNVVSFLIPGDVDFIECESGEEALGRYIIHQPDLVLMDIQMKGMDGFETVQKIYTQDATAKVIVVTSHDSPAFRNKAKELKTIGFVSKDKLYEAKEILQSFVAE